MLYLYIIFWIGLIKYYICIILDKLSNIWVEFINNESTYTFFHNFQNKEAKNLKNCSLKINTILHMGQWYEAHDENIINSYSLNSAR